jgi:hypothetical protein
MFSVNLVGKNTEAVGGRSIACKSVAKPEMYVELAPEIIRQKRVYLY